MVEGGFLSDVFGVFGVGGVLGVVTDLPADVGLEAAEAEAASLLVDMIEGRDTPAFVVAADAGLAELASLDLPFCLVAAAGLLVFKGDAGSSDADDVAGADVAGPF